MMPSLICPECGNPAFSFWKKLALGPLWSKPCEHCGVRLTVGWGANAINAVLMSLSMCTVGIVVVVLSPPDLLLPLFAIGAGTASIPFMWTFVRYVPLIRRQVQSVTEGVNSNFAVQNVQQTQLKNEFALEKNTASLVALIIMVSMLIYALVDTVFINLYEIVGYPDNKSLLIVLSAMPICLLGFGIHSYMIRSSVPERETIVLTTLCVISFAIAAHPLLQRIDTIIASKPMQTYNYRMVKPGVFEPIEIGPPKLNLRTQCEYWQQYTVKTTFQISLQHGGLGMWQLDGEALDKDIYAYLKKLHPSNFIGNFRIK